MLLFCCYICDDYRFVVDLLIPDVVTFIDSIVPDVVTDWCNSVLIVVWCFWFTFSLLRLRLHVCCCCYIPCHVTVVLLVILNAFDVWFTLRYTICSVRLPRSRLRCRYSVCCFALWRCYHIPFCNWFTVRFYVTTYVVVTFPFPIRLHCWPCCVCCCLLRSDRYVVALRCLLLLLLFVTFISHIVATAALLMLLWRCVFTDLQLNSHIWEALLRFVVLLHITICSVTV